jgi:tetratricopeptide (TPR) repeat protein
MSPEQHRGQTADARADQFSFCVALYEALYKQLPFEGATFLVYQDNVLAGRVREAPKGSDVPVRIYRVLRRGLSLAPADRYPDMDALLDELARDPAAMYRRVALIGGAIAAVGTLAFVVVRALRVARREACVATAVRHEQSADLLDRRMQCIDQRAAATRALIGVMTEHHEAETLAKSVDAAASLEPLEPCADRAMLMSEIPLPPAAIRPQVDALAHRLDRVEAMENAGLYPKALDELAKIIADTDKLAHAPLSARAHFLAADAHIQLDHNQQGAAELRKAAELAAAAHDDTLAAKAWIGLLGATGYRLGKYEEAKGIEPAAAAAVMRAGNAPTLVGKLENSRGLIELGRDEYLAAADHFRTAAQQQEKSRTRSATPEPR